MSRSVIGSIALNIATAAAAVARTAPRRMASPRMADVGIGGPEVTVLGGGFGGLYTALRLSSLDWSGGSRPRITLVDRNERFSFSPMLYELATGTATSWEVAPLYEDLLAGTDVEFVRGSVCGLDEAQGLVSITPISDRARDAGSVDVRMLAYDRCVIALGSEPSVARVPGAANFSQPFYTPSDAIALKQKIRQLRERTDRSAIRVCVIGGGYIGAELAANLASTLPPSEVLLSLVHRSDALLMQASDHSRTVAERKLADAGVNVILNTEVANVANDTLTLRPCGPSVGGAAAPVEGATASYELPVDLTVWTAGVQPASAMAALELPCDESGKLCVDASLRVPHRPNLFALGDACAITDAAGAMAPSTAQAAMQQADYAAWNVRASLRDGVTLPFRYVALGEMLSLGSDAAAISAAGQLVKLSGPLASASRRAVYAARMPTARQAAKVGISWAVDSAFAALRRAAMPPRS